MTEEIEETTLPQPDTEETELFNTERHLEQVRLLQEYADYLSKVAELKNKSVSFEGKVNSEVNCCSDRYIHYLPMLNALLNNIVSGSTVKVTIELLEPASLKEFHTNKLYSAYATKENKYQWEEDADMADYLFPSDSN